MLILTLDEAIILSEISNKIKQVNIVASRKTRWKISGFYTTSGLVLESIAFVVTAKLLFSEKKANMVNDNVKVIIDVCTVKVVHISRSQVAFKRRIRPLN